MGYLARGEVFKQSGLYCGRPQYQLTPPFTLLVVFIEQKRWLLYQLIEHHHLGPTIFNSVPFNSVLYTNYSFLRVLQCCLSYNYVIYTCSSTTYWKCPSEVLLSYSPVLFLVVQIATKTGTKIYPVSSSVATYPCLPCSQTCSWFPCWGKKGKRSIYVQIITFYIVPFLLQCHSDNSSQSA